MDGREGLANRGGLVVNGDERVEVRCHRICREGGK